MIIKNIRHSVRKLLGTNLATVSKHTFLPDKLTPNSVVVDLGVDSGQFSNPIVKNFRCKLIGAEAIEPVYRKHSDKYFSKAIDNVAIGARTGLETIFFIQSKLQPEHYGNLWSMVGDDDSWRCLKTQKIETISFPDFLKRWSHYFPNNTTFIDLVKFDIEGAEVDVLNNIPDELLLKIGQLTLEFHVFMFPSQKLGVQSLIERFKSLNFAYFDFSRGGNMSNVLFVNRSRVQFGRLSELYLRGVIFLNWLKYDSRLVVFFKEKSITNEDIISPEL